ncbi:uncharacterized protein ACA1_091080 [Acanthamoeba castellanii str. Neff]|uniref:Uncharacterized protein n=1 Tax=Acanthamoeba castellanii (strain ATCC 30010 / Neff) TaxID=1257118 RepID=L8GIQ1_ACACF|nr:uncharacterized protein ACA1_091080 [Acanthamoeba castellanii str. Neff]ELR12608.1 hypothetical protein ACA1_091080 [Acanthamoeba castellanii str. Neff]
MERLPSTESSSNRPKLPKDFPALAEPGQSRVQLLRQRFEQQAAAAQQDSSAARPRSGGWPDDFKRVDVRSLRQRLFAEPDFEDSRGRRPTAPHQQAVVYPLEEEQPQRQMATWEERPPEPPPREEPEEVLEADEEKRHPPAPPPREEDDTEEAAQHVSDAELSSLAQTLKALGLGSGSPPAAHRQPTPGRAH